MIPTMDIEWMVIKESLGLEEAARRRRAKVEQMLGMDATPEMPGPDPDGRTSVIGSWLTRAIATFPGRRSRRSTIQVAPQV